MMRVRTPNQSTRAGGRPRKTILSSKFFSKTTWSSIFWTSSTIQAGRPFNMAKRKKTWGMLNSRTTRSSTNKSRSSWMMTNRIDKESISTFKITRGSRSTATIPQIWRPSSLKTSIPVFQLWRTNLTRFSKTSRNRNKRWSSNSRLALRMKALSQIFKTKRALMSACNWPSLWTSTRKWTCP